MNTVLQLPSRRLAIGALIVIAAVCMVLLPATGHATAGVTNTYRVKVSKGILASGDTVTARAVITNGAVQQSNWWSQKTIASVVRTGVDRGYAKPYISQGYRCKAIAKAWIGTFNCTLTGADVPTVVKLTFHATWRH